MLSRRIVLNQETNMDFNRLGHSGLRVPALGFGTATFGGGNDFFKAWGSTDAAGASRLIDVCLEHGVSLFDSADVYSAGLAEQILGEAIKGKRNRLLISTKTTFPMGTGPNDFGSSRQHILDAVDASLTRLGTEHIDLLQLHGQDYNTPVEKRWRRWTSSFAVGRSAMSVARTSPAGT
jgi:aryl-alcohol dehydrogenase-like predicted oxidoreductase